MTANQLFWTCIAALGIVAAGVFLYSPARAQDAICLTVGDAVSQAEQTGGHLIDLIDIDGQYADQIIIAQVAGTKRCAPSPRLMQVNGCTTWPVWLWAKFSTSSGVNAISFSP